MKRKSLILLFVLCLTFSLTSCGKVENIISENIIQQKEKDEKEDQEIEEVQLETSHDERKHGIHLMSSDVCNTGYSENMGEDLVQMEYKEIWLENCCAEQYPNLNQAIIKMNADEQTSIETVYQNMMDQVNSFREEGYAVLYTYEVNEEAYVRRADENIFSVMYRKWECWGNAHVDRYRWGVNIDPVTGENISLADVVTDINMIPAMVSEYILKYNQQSDTTFYVDVEQYVREHLDELKWSMDYSGLNIYFAAYELDSYAGGDFCVVIPFTDEPDLFLEKYKNVPDCYGIQLRDSEDCYVDFNNDSQMDKVQVASEENEYGMTAYKIFVNDTVTTGEFEFYSVDAYLLKAEGGQWYLYIQGVSDNDYRTIDVYHIDTAGAEKVDSVDAGWYSVMLEESDGYAEQILTDPEAFKLDTRTEYLSTATAYKSYKIGNDGMPVTDDSWYQLQNDWVLTLKQPISAELVDENTGELVEEVSLNAGEQVRYLRTDNKTLADLRRSDGTIVRVVVDTEKWPRTIDGVDIETIFDGIIFAG